MQHSNCNLVCAKRNRIRMDQKSVEHIFHFRWLFASLALSLAFSVRNALHLITCICYNKVLSCEVDHIVCTVSQVHEKKQQNHEQSEAAKKANRFNAMENNYDRKKNVLMYCVIAMLLHQFDTSIISALRLIDRLRMRTLSLSLSLRPCWVATLCTRDRSISAHNLTHLSVLVCVIFFTSFSLLHPFSPADDDDDDDDDRVQCSRSFCTNAINLVDEILWPVCLCICSLWYSNLEHDFSAEMLFFALPHDRLPLWCAHF